MSKLKLTVFSGSTPIGKIEIDEEYAKDIEGFALNAYKQDQSDCKQVLEPQLKGLLDKNRKIIGFGLSSFLLVASDKYRTPTKEKQMSSNQTPEQSFACSYCKSNSHIWLCCTKRPPHQAPDELRKEIEILLQSVLIHPLTPSEENSLYDCVEQLIKEKQMSSNPLSNCHQAPLKAITGDEGTSFYQCSECLKPADPQTPPTKARR